MLPYLVVDAILILLFLLEEYGTVVCDKFSCFATFKKALGKKIFYGYASVGVIGLFMGLRGSFTSDYSSYCDIFLDTVPKSFWEAITGYAYQEKGFLLLNKVVGCFTSNPNVFLFLEAFRPLHRLQLQLLYAIVIFVVRSTVTSGLAFQRQLPDAFSTVQFGV